MRDILQDKSTDSNQDRCVDSNRDDIQDRLASTLSRLDRPVLDSHGVEPRIGH